MQRFSIGCVADLGACKVLQETAKAIRVKLLEAMGTEPDQMWIPRKCLVVGNKCNNLGDVGTCLVSYNWWQKRNESIEPPAKPKQSWVPPKLLRSPRVRTP